MNLVVGDYIVSTETQGNFANRLFFIKEIGSGGSAVLALVVNFKVSSTTVTVPGFTSAQHKWVRVTNLVMSANAAILPEDDIRYETDVASAYRKQVDLAKIKCLMGADAIGKLCTLVLTKDGSKTPSNMARFVVDYTGNYYAVFDNFGSPKNSKGKDHGFAVLNVEGKEWYDAQGIIEEANKMFLEDCQLAVKYSDAITNSITKSTDSMGSSAIHADEFEGMEIR